VFFIDPESKIRALIFYPLSNGRNFDEIKRLLMARRTSDKHKVATPVDWRPGDKVIIK
jgi:peroxiredoxin (alkyl hydroperoxide reductase subunit C)